MRQQRGLDRLEQLQRRARDQQHVEDDARERARCARSRRRSAPRAFSSVCSESMMLETQTAKPPPRRSERSSCAAASCTPSVPGPASAASASSTVIGPPARRRSAVLADLRRAPSRARRAARERHGHDDQRDERRGGDAERDRRLPAARCPAPRRSRSRCARATPSARARRTGRSTGVRPASRARSSSPRRPACRRRARQ